MPIVTFGPSKGRWVDDNALGTYNAVYASTAKPGEIPQYITQGYTDPRTGSYQQKQVLNPVWLQGNMQKMNTSTITGATWKPTGAIPDYKTLLAQKPTLTGISQNIAETRGEHGESTPGGIQYQNAVDQANMNAWNQYGRQ